MKRVMRSFLMISVIVSLFSCKKESSGTTSGASYLKLKQNGTWVTYTAVGELGPDLGDATYTDFDVVTQDAAPKGQFSMAIQVHSTSLPVGTYPGTAIDYSYVDAGYNLHLFEMETAPTRTDIPAFTIHLTSITDTRLKGTLTGNYLYNSDDDEIITITEGEFDVTRYP